MIKLREYQKNIAVEAFRRLKVSRICYLAMEVRTGKTLTALASARLYCASNVLFVTKKKAIASIEEDYSRSGYEFRLTVTNYEQVQKLKPEYDFIIIDEAHSLGAYPQPSLRTKNLKKLVGKNPLILLSGTPTPESFSQLYHQFWVSDYSPFSAYKNFYKWAKDFVNIRQVMVNGFRINNYDKANKTKIDEFTQHLFITYTQHQAGFEAEIEEEIQEVSMNGGIYRLANLLQKERYYKMRDGSEIICDTAAKLLTKLHQVYSGTVITEDGSLKVLDRSKADYIKEAFKGKKIAIYYKYRAEETLLKDTFPNWTSSPEEFQKSNKCFISQIQSGSMGVNLSTADVILFYNIDYSSLSYWQARARSQSAERKENSRIVWIFAEGGIEEEIYKAVIKKKDFTTNYFRGVYDIK